MDSPNKTTASAPGKALICGGYSILEKDNVGVVLALNARFRSTVSISQRTSDYITVYSPQLTGSQKKRVYRIDTMAGTEADEMAIDEVDSSSETEPNRFVEYTLLYTIAVAQHLLPYITFSRLFLRGLDITLEADKEFYDGNGKTGLGSSAALVASLTASLLVHCNLIDHKQASSSVLQGFFPSQCVCGGHEGLRLQFVHNLAQLSHSAAQRRVGSGFDISAAIYGSQLYRRFDAPKVWNYVLPKMNEKRTVAIPHDVVACVCPSAIRQERFRVWTYVVGVGVVLNMLLSKFLIPFELPVFVIVLMVSLLYSALLISTLSRTLLDGPTSLRGYSVISAMATPTALITPYVLSCTLLSHVSGIVMNSEYFWTIITSTIISIAAVISGWMSASYLWPVIEWVNMDSMQRWMLPRGTRIVMGVVGHGSSTVPLASKVLAWRDSSVHGRTLWETLGNKFNLAYHELDKYSGSPSSTKTAFKAVRGVLNSIGVECGCDMVPDSVMRLCDATDDVDGVVGVSVPGAGGHDAMFAIIEDNPMVLDAVSSLWESSGVRVLNVVSEETGVIVYIY